MTTSARDLGPLVATYRKSRSFLFVGWFMAALFIGVGAFVLWLGSRVGSPGFTSAATSRCCTRSATALGLGVALIFLIWRLGASQPTFQLFQNGIRASGPDGDTRTLYRDIEDLYTFFYGGIGYRAAPGAPWTFIGGRTSRFAELSERLRGAQNGGVPLPAR